MTKIIQIIGKFTGIVSGVGASALWLFGMWSPTPPLALAGVSFLVALLMSMFAILTVIASIRGHGMVLIVLFFASFFPIGYFMLALPGWVSVIGLLNLGYLIAGLVAWRFPSPIERPNSSRA